MGDHHQDLRLHQYTIMAEALEKWPIELFSRLLPRIYQIVEEINRRFILDIQQKYSNVPGVDVQEKIRKMAIIYDGQVKMANRQLSPATLSTVWQGCIPRSWRSRS